MTYAQMARTSGLIAGCLYLVLHPLVAAAWDTGPENCKHDECTGGAKEKDSLKWGGNTHLWVVNRAIDLLAKSSDPTAKVVVARMNSKTCREQWEAGLFDVDHGFLAEDFGTGQTDANMQRLGSTSITGRGATLLATQRTLEHTVC
jgi:hypothetical protein